MRTALAPRQTESGITRAESENEQRRQYRTLATKMTGGHDLHPCCRRQPSGAHASRAGVPVTITSRTWFTSATTVVLLLVVPFALFGQPTGNRFVIILSPTKTDARLAHTREAITFWNRTFSTLNLKPRLLEAAVIVGDPASRALETYARQISQRAGRVSPGRGEPDPPKEVTDLAGDIVLLLSKQPIMSFAWPLPRSERFFVAIQIDPTNSSSDNPNISRNIIAHELGHTLGLTHNNDPATLMCRPCRPEILPVDELVFLPLTANDSERLSDLYGSP